jgi:hypothetical protein
MKLQRWKKLTEYVFKIDGTAVLSAALCMILSCVLFGDSTCPCYSAGLVLLEVVGFFVHVGLVFLPPPL